MQQQRLLSLLWIQIGISRTHRQPIGFTHDGADDNLDWQIQIAHHAPDDRYLRGIFLPEESSVRLDDVKQLGNDGRDAAKVSGARTPIEFAAQLLYGRPGHCIGWIHLLDRRRKEEVHALALEHLAVALERSRILGQVFIRPKLRGVYKDAGSYYAARRGRRPNQR